MVDESGTAVPFRVTPAVFHVLLALSGGAAHAYGIMKEIEARTHGSVKVGPGSLHFTLGKLQDAALIESCDAPDGDEVDSRRKYVCLTSRGREVLTAELGTLEEIVELARERKLMPGQGTA